MSDRGRLFALRRPARVAASRWALLLALTLAACTQAGSPRPVADRSDAAAREAPARCLFKIHVRDGERDGRFRLVLWEDATGFRLAASDPIGRGLWIYDQAGGSGLWVDRRNESLCRLEGDVTLEVEEFGSVPVDSIPALLRGRYREVPAGLVPEVLGDEVRLSRDRRSLSWNSGHCEASDGSRPSLERYLGWPKNCAVDAGRGE